MLQDQRLHPFDVVLALRLLRTEATLAELGRELHRAPSQIFQSLRRLEAAGLVRPGTRAANRLALEEFIEHGVRYAFPAAVGTQAVGIPTAHSGPDLATEIVAADRYVWADSSARGAVRGIAISPLYPAAPKLRESSPETYRALALVDAVRVGRTRERALAVDRLRKMFAHA